MDVALYTHEAMLGHRPGLGHPERPERLASVLAALDDASDLRLDRREAPRAAAVDLQRVHPHAYVARIERSAPAEGLRQLDPDTWMSAGSEEAALRAAGAATAATLSVARGQAQRAFCAIRPPGHHAEPETPMGFCIFSNVAVAAKAALAEGMGRVAVVDFDIHHGNGTQAALAGEPGLMLASIQQWPMWPGSGHPSEKVAPNIVNAVVPPGAPPAAWRRAFGQMLGRVDDFAPELILVSAGFDAHRRDPIGGAGQSLEAEDFAWATRAIVSLARAHAKGRVVSSLEGGYDLEALSQSALAHVRALGEG